MPGSGEEALAGGETNLAIGGMQCARVLGHWDEDRHMADGPRKKKEVRILFFVCDYLHFFLLVTVIGIF